MVFNPEFEVPSKELCKKLKELGFPQESSDGGGWYWVLEELTYKEVWKLKLLHNIPYAVDNLKIKAPTCREILEWIETAYQKYVADVPPTYTSSEIEPNALAKELIWLAENGYVKFK